MLGGGGYGREVTDVARLSSFVTDNIRWDRAMAYQSSDAASTADEARYDCRLPGENASLLATLSRALAHGAPGLPNGYD